MEDVIEAPATDRIAVTEPRAGRAVEPAEAVDFGEYATAAVSEAQPQRSADEAGAGEEGPVELPGEVREEGLERALLEAMCRTLREPQWYLTGVQVGLESLRRLHEASRLVYVGGSDRSEGARKVQNLRSVYDQLLAFRESEQPVARARILLEHRGRFEALLADLEDGRRSIGLRSERRTLFEQVAKDLTEAGNRLRSHENLERALARVRGVPRMLGKLRAKRIAELLEGYAALLTALGWAEAAGFETDGQIDHKLRTVRDTIRRTRRHLAAVRDALYENAKDWARHADRPELDLEARSVIKFLRHTSRDGLAYLQRAYCVYEHAVERSPHVQRLLAAVSSGTPILDDDAVELSVSELAPQTL